MSLFGVEGCGRLAFDFRFATVLMPTGAGGDVAVAGATVLSGICEAARRTAVRMTGFSAITARAKFLRLIDQRTSPPAPPGSSPLIPCPMLKVMSGNSRANLDEAKKGIAKPTSMILSDWFFAAVATNLSSSSIRLSVYVGKSALRESVVGVALNSW